MAAALGMGKETACGWGNGVTNGFSGEFHGDKLWDIGVTGDRIRRNGTWFIRCNSSPPASGGAAGSPPAGVDAANCAGRWPRWPSGSYSQNRGSVRSEL